MEKMIIKMIVAVNKKNYIGRDGKMMWRSPTDFTHFKNATMGGVLIVGKNTFLGDLRGKQLPGRETIVVGSGYNTLFDAVKKAIATGKQIWVIGGPSIYNQLLPLAGEIHISHINDDQDGDISFVVPDSYRGEVIHYYFDVAENT